jgi:hypothetical protein
MGDLGIVPAVTCHEDIFASSKTDARRHIGAFASELGLPEPSDAVFEALSKTGQDSASIAEFVPAAVKGIARLSTLPPWRNPFDPAPA